MSNEVGTPRYLSLVVPLVKVSDETVHKELGNRMERAATTASSLEAKQDIVNAIRHMLMLPVQDPAAEESDGFVEIIDFLNASYVHYASTINPIIYTSCIEQFWATAKVQTVNEVQGTDCLPTATIFEELARMGAKSTAWNEFSSTMASLIICFATNQKFNLFKYIFDAMVKHLDGGVKFLMYLYFLQVFINQQLGDMSHHKKIYVNPSHTKKFFANMKRAGKGFSRRITPLFDTMMVQASEEVGEDSDHPTDSNQIPITEHEESIPTPSNDPLPSGEDSMQLNDLMVLCTKLQTQVLDLEKAKDAQVKEIADLKKRVQRLERKKKSRTTDASKLGRSIEDIDADAEVTLVNETQERQDDDLMFDTEVLDDDEVFVDVTTVEKEEQSTNIGEAVTTAGIEDSVAPTIPTTIEETLAQTLMEIKAAKPKAKGIVFHAHEEQVYISKPTVSVTQTSVKDKREDAEIIEKERLERKKQEEANIALNESWENTQAMMEADRLLAERLQTRER
ncbi:hypothetical protein Tco_1242088 [Tanacetum coccineum]